MKTSTAEIVVDLVYSPWIRGAADRIVFNDDDDPAVLLHRAAVGHQRAAGQPTILIGGARCDVMDYAAHDDKRRRPFELYRLIEQTPGVNWLLLTKFYKRYVELLPIAWLDQSLMPANVMLLSSTYLGPEAESIPLLIDGCSIGTWRAPRVVLGKEGHYLHGS